MKPSSSSPPVSVGAAPDAAFPHAQDLLLVRRILDGDATAWAHFVERYAGLILAMARRYLRSRDQDDIRMVFVKVLESLRKSRLRTYEGRASLSTWLTLVARSEVVDHLRRQFGRDPKMKALRRLTHAQRTLFRLYCIEGRSRRETLDQIETDGERWSEDRFVAALHEIERKLGDRWFKRLAYDLHAQSVGAASGRLLEYLDHVRVEFEQHAGTFSPDYYLMEREAKRTVDRLRAAIRDLPPGDRRLIELRFEQGWTARRIATELGMNGERRVYSTIERIVNALRRHLRSGNEEP